MTKNQKKFKEIAGDFNSPFIRNYILSSAFFRYPELLDLPVVTLFTYNDDGVLTYFTDHKSWAECHLVLKARIEQDYEYLEKLIKKTLDFGEEALIWAKQTLTRPAILTATDLELCDLYDLFFEKQSWLYVHGTTLPILDFQGFSFLESKLELLLNSISDPDERAKYFEALTYPTSRSFSQEQEETLLVLASKWCNIEGWKDAVVSLSFEDVSAKFPTFIKELEEHTQAFFWVYYAYAGPSYTPEDFFLFIKNDLKSGIDPQEKLVMYHCRRIDIKNRKEEFIEKYANSLENKWVARMVGTMVWAKPRRKEYQSALYAYVEQLQKEIGRRLHLSLTQVRSMTPTMIRESLVLGNPVDVDFVNSVSKNHLCLPDDNGGIKIIIGAKAKSFFDTYHLPDEIHANVDVLNGMCAYKGFVSGRVTVVNSVNDVGKMKNGDILVSLATTPTIVPAMKKAGAIITDEGGLTCHAAIVSRELGIPCVIGTKIATQVLKDGDMVEVDANKGIVRKL